MRVIKKKAKATYKNKDGKERHYYNYYLEFDNGCRVAIRTFDVADLKKLDAICVFEG